MGRQTLSGLRWQTTASFIRVLYSFGFGVVLARLLAPEDFGIVGVATIASGLVRVAADLGLASALIQRPIITERHVRVCHTVSVMLAVVLSTILVASAGLIGDFFNDRRVPAVIGSLSVATTFTAFGATAGAMLIRRLAFRTVVRIELISSSIGYGGVAIGLALAGAGYWSLVGGMFAQAMLASTMTYLAQRHAFRPLLARAELQELLAFGAGMSLTSIVNYAALKADQIVVGRVMNTTSLGLYSRAYALMELPLGCFGSALSHVLFPAASRVQADGVRFKRAYLAAMSISTAVSLPVSMAMIVLAPEIVSAIYGERWAPMTSVLRILCVFGMCRMSYNTASAFLRARGQSYHLLGCTVVYGALVGGGTVWAATTGGLSAVAWSVGSAITCMWILVLGFAGRAAGVSASEFCRELAIAAAPGVGIGALLGIVAGAMRAGGAPAGVLLAVASAVFTIAFCAALIHQSRRVDHPIVTRYLERCHSALLSARVRTRSAILRAAWF